MPEPSDVLMALAKLSERQRAAIVLHYYAGHPLKEVAAIVGSTKATVGVHTQIQPGWGSITISSRLMETVTRSGGRCRPGLLRRRLFGP
jgi:hypothetical protein